jgi:hypothetical protein
MKKVNLKNISGIEPRASQKLEDFLNEIIQEGYEYELHIQNYFEPRYAQQVRTAYTIIYHK